MQMGTAFILPRSAASQAYRAELQGDSACSTAMLPPFPAVLRAWHGSTVCTSWDAGYAEHCRLSHGVWRRQGTLHRAASAQGGSDYAAHLGQPGAPLALRHACRPELVRTAGAGAGAGRQA